MLWHRPAAVTPVRTLAWEPPYAMGVALKKKGKKKKKGKEKKLEDLKHSTFMDWRFNIIRIAMFPKLICRFCAIAVKILADFFSAIAKLIQKFIWYCKRSLSQGSLQSSTNQDSMILS